MTDTLHVKYRPEELEEVLGQKAAVSSLKQVIKNNTAHCFLFSGPSGVGKTTLSRIVARSVGCADIDILEINAAKYTGVDDMRQLEDMVIFRPFGGEARAVILDECHMLSKSAWNSMLKITEEPPPFLYFFLCTTELGRVPSTIRTRSAAYELQPVRERELTRLVKWVAEEEQIPLDEEVCRVIVDQARGSPRQALVNLAKAGHASTKKEAAAILQSARESEPTLELCQLLVSGGSFPKAMTICAKMESENPESVRIVVCNYIASVLKNAKTDNEALKLLHKLDCFASSYNPSDGRAPLLLSIGRALFAPIEE